MSVEQSSNEFINVAVRNVGGINETEVVLEEGVTVLEGENATNRTSFLQALMAAMGSDEYSLKADAEAGSVRMEMDGTVVERRFERRNGDVWSDDGGYLDDTELADLFGFLLGNNEARRAVERGDDLRELIMRPVDTAAIEADIRTLQAEKQRLDDDIERIDDREAELESLERDRERLEDEIDDTRATIEDLQAQIDAAETDLAESRERDAELEAKMDELATARSELDDVRFRIETTEERIDSLREERVTKEERRAELADVDDPAVVREQLDRLRDRKRDLDATINEVRSVVEFNEEMLSGTTSEIAEVLGADRNGDEGSPTDELLDDNDEVVCWTCGSTVDRDAIESTVERLRSFQQDRLGERRSVAAEIETHSERLSDLEAAENERDAIEERLSEIDDEIQEAEDRRDSLLAEREELAGAVDRLEQEIETIETADYSDLLDLNERVTELEYDLERKQSDLDGVVAELESIEELLDAREEYVERRSEIADELEELRTRIDRLQRQAVDRFNTHMDAVLDILDYDNVERIWIERTTGESSGDVAGTDAEFVLHVVRHSEDGYGYEDTIDHLSESERAVTGLVFALAGYLVHDVHEVLPVMLLDSLEAIDGDRIAKLIEYFADHARFLVVALLPADAGALDEGYRRIADI